MELGIVLLIVLLVFGPKKLPGLGKQLGSGMREFKESISGSSKHDDDDDDVARPELKRATSTETRVAPVEQQADTPVTRDPQA